MVLFTQAEDIVFLSPCYSPFMYLTLQTTDSENILSEWIGLTHFGIDCFNFLGLFFFLGDGEEH